MSLDTITKTIEEYLHISSQLNKNIQEIIEVLKRYGIESSANNLSAMTATLSAARIKTEKVRSRIDLLNQAKIITDSLQWIEREQSALTKKTEEYIDMFGRDLDEQLSRSGFEIKGHYPIFQVRNLKIKVDSSKLKLSIVYGGDEEKIDDVLTFDAKTVVERVKDLYQYLDKTDYQKELDSIHTAYIFTIRKLNESEGSWAPIISILNEYVMLSNSSARNKDFFINPRKDAFREIGPYRSRIILSYVIYKILESDWKAHGKYRLNKKTAIHGAATKHEEHLWLPIKQDDVLGENAMYLNFTEAD